LLVSESPVPVRHVPYRDRGEELSIRAGAYEATFSTVGSVLESLTVGGRDLVLRNPDQGPIAFYRGALVAPWPNRIGDGLYTWDGESHQAPINEIERDNALHGLLTFQYFTLDTHEPSRLVLSTILYPSPAYPFVLRLEAEHVLDPESGLTTTITARNLGAQDAPFGVCPHPYVLAGPEPLDSWTLQVPAETLLEVTPDRLLPIGTAPTADSPELDFRSPRVITDRFIDHAYTGLVSGEDGRARITVTAPGGTGVEVSADGRCPWVQVHTGDRPEPEANRKGLAVEPMTCPPDAFRSGQDVVRLAPGADHTVAWSIRGW
jgi:aldose 1-epimerase